MNTTELNLTPKDIVERLDRYIVGQDDAKKAVAIALRNRYRRLQLSADMQKEITPKNILMIGPTGVGKTEIARRLADIVNAPFVKLEATKFTEVGYVGRDVESMVRDLVENAVHLVREQKRQEVRGKAQQQAIKRVAKALAPSKKDTNAQQAQNPFASLFQGAGGNPQQQMANLFGGGAPDVEEDVSEEIATKRKDSVNQIERGVPNSREVDIMVEEKKQTPNNPMSQQMEQMGIDLSSLGSLGPQKKVKRTVTVKEAVDIFTDEEADKLINTEDINSEAIQLAENNGIIFLDEIDKITVREQQGGGNGQVSREGVQRDILPIVEGSTVRTKYGTLKTDHVLFIGSGAFHMSKPSDLIPELQGRFPIRVELNDLTKDNFVQILTEPKNALIEQYKALIGTENVDVIFTMESIERIAEIAFEVNENTDNIGARRLHTIVEKLLEELLFKSPSMQSGEVKITEKYVDEKIGEIATNTDLSRYIL